MSHRVPIRMVRLTSLLLLSVIAPIGCSTCKKVGHHLESFERALGTDSDLDREFHVVATDPQGAGLRMPGYLIGFEKTERSLIEVPKLSDDSHLNDAPTAFSNIELKRLRNRMDDGKRMFLSHAVAYRAVTLPTPYIRVESIYDAYSDGSFDERRGTKPIHVPTTRSAYEESWRAIDTIRDSIRRDLESAKNEGEAFTHLIVGSMGWHNRQLKSLRNLNSLFGNLCLAARDDCAADFRPLFVAVTWPSDWAKGPGVSSYPNKANDADELGYSFVSYLLNDALSGLRRDVDDDLKIVAIGHSFGARMMTRAAFSGSVLKPARSLSEGVDLVVALQGAFSFNRFLMEWHEKGKGEGGPYRKFNELRGAIVLTWSDFDDANPVAEPITGAKHAGGTPGYERALEYSSRFTFATAAQDGTYVVSPRSKNIVMVDATQLVNHRFYGTAGLAHSDINNRDMGRLVWSSIKRFAQ